MHGDDNKCSPPLFKIDPAPATSWQCLSIALMVLPDFRITNPCGQIRRLDLSPLQQLAYLATGCACEQARPNLNSISTGPA